QIIGVGDKLAELEKEELDFYNERRAIGQIEDQKKKFAKEMPYYNEAPIEPISINDLIQQQQDILARNAENQQKRQQLSVIQNKHEQEQQEIARLEQQLNALKQQHLQTTNDLEIAQKDALDLVDESTEELENNIAEIDAINLKVRANLDKDKAEEDAQQYKVQYDQLTVKIEQIRKEKIDLLQSADLPLPELSVANGELIYKGQQWDNMSGSDQLKVATAIVRKLKPNCGFILLDKLEQMDLETMNEFGQWLEQEGLQAIATRVSTGDECEIIIEDGYVSGQATIETEPVQQQENNNVETPTWKPGEF